MKRRLLTVEPLGFLVLMRTVVRGRDDRAVAVRFVEEHRAQLEAHAAGLPLRHDHDGTKLAAQLLGEYGGAQRRRASGR